MKRILIQLGLYIAITLLFGRIAGWIFIICSLLLTHTKRGLYISLLIMQHYMMWKYLKLYPWFKKHKNSWLFKSLENASWFPWYGKRVVYVKAKDSSKLSATQLDVKEAIKQKDYKRALDIVSGLPVTPQTIALKQIIVAKL